MYLVHATPNFGEPSPWHNRKIIFVVAFVFIVFRLYYEELNTIFCGNEIRNYI